jgi:hypothetical protein
LFLKACSKDSVELAPVEIAVVEVVVVVEVGITLGLEVVVG